MCPHLTHSATSRPASAPTHTALAHTARVYVHTTHVKRTSHISGRVAWPSMITSSRRAASVKVYEVVLMLCSCFSRRSAAAAAPREGVCRCPLMISSFTARAELVLALLARCAELFLLHAADCVDGVQSCEDEGMKCSRLRRAIDMG